MIYAVTFPFCVALFELFALLKIGRDAKAIITRSQQALRVLRSSELADDDKEVLMRRGSADIFKATLRFALKFLVIGGVLYLLFLLTVTLFPALKQAMLESLYSPVVIAVLTVATLCYAWVRRAIVARVHSGDRA
jgi:hypothetical protein